MVKWLAMWTGSIALFVIFLIVTQSMLEGDRGFIESGDEGFKVLYPKDLDVTGVHVLFDVVDEPTKILFFVVAKVENRTDPAMFAVQIPYQGEIASNSGWGWRPFDDSTLFVKTFDCNEEKPCSFVQNMQFFEMKLNEPIDQKQSFLHSVRLWFSQSNMLLDLKIPPYIKATNPHRKPYETGFKNIESSVATVIFDKSTDRFAATPQAPIIPGPRPNTIQIDWNLQGGILHQIDYQIPKERKTESQMLYYTAVFGIGLGITNLAIYGAEQRSKKIKKDLKRQYLFDKYGKDAINDAYHNQYENGENNDENKKQL